MTLTDDEQVTLTKTATKKTFAEQDEEPLLLGKTAGDSKFPVPLDAEFGTAEFTTDKTLAMLASHLIGTKANLAHLSKFTVRVAWKRVGGQKAGKPRYGDASKPTGWVRYISDDDFVVWLAADHCRELSKTEIEMHLFRQLCACGQDDEGNRVLLPPDFADYVAVVREYGAMTAELRQVKAALQLGLGI